MAQWPPRVAFHDEFEWNARELEVFLDQPRPVPPTGSFRPPLLDASELNNFGSHGWSLPGTPHLPRLATNPQLPELPGPKPYLKLLHQRLRRKAKWR
eukprot:g790.t1